MTVSAMVHLTCYRFQEEALLEEAGVYELEEENLTEEQKDVREKAGLIRTEKAVIRHKHRLNKHRSGPGFAYSGFKLTK